MIVSAGSALATTEMQKRTHSVPIVFVYNGDPIVTGIIRNVGHPEGNTTGVANVFVSIMGKWVELLKEAAPQVASMLWVESVERKVAQRA